MAIGKSATKKIRTVQKKVAGGIKNRAKRTYGKK